MNSLPTTCEKVPYHEATKMSFSDSYDLAKKISMNKVVELIKSIEEPKDIDYAVAIIRHKPSYYGTTKTSVVKAVDQKIKELTLKKSTDEILFIIQSLVPFASYNVKRFGFIDEEERRFFFNQTEWKNWKKAKKLIKKTSTKAN